MLMIGVSATVTILLLVFVVRSILNGDYDKSSFERALFDSEDDMNEKR